MHILSREIKKQNKNLVIKSEEDLDWYIRQYCEKSYLIENNLKEEQLLQLSDENRRKINQKIENFKNLILDIFDSL